MDGLTEIQAKILKAVVEEASLQGWRVPRGKSLLALLNKHHIGHLSSTRGMNDHLKRIQRKTDCFEERNSHRYINMTKLCVYEKTALYITCLEEVISKCRKADIPKDSFHNFLVMNFGLEENEVEKISQWAVKANLIVRHASSREYLNIEDMVKDQKPYLVKLISSYNWQEAINNKANDFF